MSSTSEWFHFHQNTNTDNNTPSLGHVSPSYAATSPPDLFFSGLVSESTVVSTPTTPIPPGPAQLGPVGRVTKPTRRRTRASRRTPTTLLNTDTANFRAMVQQFTGGPSNCSSPLPGLGPQGFGIGPDLGYGLQFPMAQVQYGNGTMSSSSSNNNNNNNNMLMGSNMVDNNNNISNDAYFTRGSNNNVVNGGSSSSENRSSNNSFQF